MKTKKVSFLLFVSLIILSSLICGVRAETFTVPPLQEITRDLDLKEENKVEGEISVIGGTGNDINFYVTDPTGDIIINQPRVTHTEFSFTASIDGIYTLHFDNTFSLISSKSVTLDYSISGPGFPAIFIYIIIIIVAIAAVTITGVIILLRRRAPPTPAPVTAPRSERVPQPPPERPVYAKSIRSVPPESECYICKQPVAPSDTVLQCPSCKRIFHDGCLRSWIELNRRCPMCEKRMEIS